MVHKCVGYSSIQWLVMATHRDYNCSRLQHIWAQMIQIFSEQNPQNNIKYTYTHYKVAWVYFSHLIVFFFFNIVIIPVCNTGHTVVLKVILFLSLHFRWWEIWFAEISEWISNGIFWQLPAERAESGRAEATHHIQRSGLWTGWYTHMQMHNNNVCQRFSLGYHTFVSTRNSLWKAAMSQLCPGSDYLNQPHILPSVATDTSFISPPPPFFKKYIDCTLTMCFVIQTEKIETFFLKLFLWLTGRIWWCMKKGQKAKWFLLSALAAISSCETVFCVFCPWWCKRSVSAQKRKPTWILICSVSLKSYDQICVKRE